MFQGLEIAQNPSLLKIILKRFKKSFHIDRMKSGERLYRQSYQQMDFRMGVNIDSIKGAILIFCPEFIKIQFIHASFGLKLV